MRIPKATVNSKVPATMNTLSLRTFKMTNPRSDPVITDAKLSLELVSIHEALGLLNSPIQGTDSGGRGNRLVETDEKDWVEIGTL